MNTKMKSKKVIFLIAMLLVISCCSSISASASKYYWTGISTTQKYDFEKKYFNASPQNQIRCIATPTCSVSSAKVIYRLYYCPWIGNATEMSRAQTQVVNKGQVRTWWRETNQHDFAVTLEAINNQNNSGTRQTVKFNGNTWVENFSGNYLDNGNS